MSRKRGSRRYALPNEPALEQAAGSLAASLGASVEPARPVDWVWLDSFDGRLWRDGGTLRFDEEGELLWADLDGGERARVPCGSAPRWPAEVALPRVQEGLARLLGPRALLPVVRVRGGSCALRWVDELDKTVLRGAVEELEAVDERGEVVPLGRRLQLDALRGYEERAREVGRRVHGEVVRASWMEEALAALGRQPGDQAPSLAVQLRPYQRSSEACRWALRQVAAWMWRNEPGVPADLDSEFLHDFRVAVRRQRAALNQLRDVFPTAPRVHFAAELAWLGQVTGPTRDLDVYLLDWPELRAALAPERVAALSPVEVLLRERQVEAHQALVAALDSDRYRSFCADWAAFLDQVDVPDPGAPQASAPVIELARRRVRRLLRQVHDEGGLITHESPSTELHELRKTCKKLRYVLEFFRSLFDADEVGRGLRELKRLQDNLGDFQDLEVHASALQACAEALRDREPEVLGPVAELVALLHRRQEDARAAFERTFAGFVSKRVRRGFAAMLREEGG